MSDGLDLATVTIHNSHDVHGWPATATITRLEFRADGVHVEHTKNQGAGCWPNFRPPGWDGDLQYTLWIFLNISGAWHASGCIEFWQSCDKNGGPPEGFAANWYYAADRWAPMTGHQPAPGELVGFMVSAGDARNSGAQSVQERSQIVALPFPSSGGVWVLPPPVDPPVVPPVDPPVPPPPDPPVPLPPPVPVPLPTPDRLVQILEQAVVILQQGSEAIARLEETVATKDDLAKLRSEVLQLGKALAAALATGNPTATALAALQRLLGRPNV